MYFAIMSLCGATSVKQISPKISGRQGLLVKVALNSDLGYTPVQTEVAFLKIGYLI